MSTDATRISGGLRTGSVLGDHVGGHFYVVELIGRTGGLEDLYVVWRTYLYTYLYEGGSSHGGTILLSMDIDARAQGIGHCQYRHLMMLKRAHRLDGDYLT